MSTASRTRAFKALVFVLALVPLALLSWDAWGILSGTRPNALGADPIREAQIQTGLWTLRFLAITLAVTPVRELLALGVLARFRRMFGLFTFAYATIHLAIWVGVDWFFDWGAMWKEIVKHRYILVGMATFGCMLPLALTSTNKMVRRLGGARWVRLHRLVYVCAITGTVHYLWAVKKDTFFPLVYLLLFAALLGFRAWEHFVAPLRLRSPARRATSARRAVPSGVQSTTISTLREAE